MQSFKNKLLFRGSTPMSAIYLEMHQKSKKNEWIRIWMNRYVIMLSIVKCEESMGIHCKILATFLNV